MELLSLLLYVTLLCPNHIFFGKISLQLLFPERNCFSSAYLGLFLWKNYKAYFFPWLLLVCQGICNRPFQLFIMHGEAMFGF